MITVKRATVWPIVGDCSKQMHNKAYRRVRSALGRHVWDAQRNIHMFLAPSSWTFYALQ